MILRALFFAVLFAVAASQPFAPAYANAQQIVAVVNEDAITQKDLDDRMKLIMASSGMPNTPDIRRRLAPQVINTLIEEQIMVQQARALKIDIKPEEIEKGFASLAKQNKMSAEDFKAMLKRGGISTLTLQNQIKAHLSWSLVVQQRLSPRVNVTERDVDDLLGRMTKNVGRSEYLLAEIFLPVDDAGSEAKVKQLAGSMMTEIKAGRASFYKLAQQFSKSAGSANGGDLGWVQEDQVAKELADALKGMTVDQVSEPIRSPNGYHILFIREKRQLASENLPSREKVFTMLGLERLDRMQRGYMLDLKASAFIENRVES
ncbi:MAG: peptidylprolyl isomerase [Alphaproteobacteria bacterium]|nr:peptidylprolyl isomerase [Alphaproteobacteria bacterium]